MKRLLIVFSVSAVLVGWAMFSAAEARGTITAPLPSRDREVILQAQRQLKALGFNPGAIDGNLGPQTNAAIREYQRAYRLPQTGAPDEATLRSLLPERFQTPPAPTLSNREVIVQAQRKLKVLGFNPGTTDGDIGPQTEAAIREYQRAYRLPQTGALDEATLRSLVPELTERSAR